ncbi:MAG: phosphoesterase [bacterium]|nr:MAG: phosphoesterase [bacterium]
MDFTKAIEFLKTKNGFLLSTHKNPDGDGIGSILAIAGILDNLGKEYTIISHDPTPKKLSFLARTEEIRSCASSAVENKSFDVAVIIDSPNLERIGCAARFLSSDVKILNIDHHVSNQRYGYRNLIVPEASSSAQVVGGIYEKMGIKPDPASAQALYVGLCVDTGRFRFNNTTPEVFRFAALLLECGAVPDKIADWLYFLMNRETLEGLSKILSSVRIYKNGKVAFAQLDHDFLNSDAGRKMDTEGFVNYPLSIEGVEAAFLLREEEKGKTRVSLRSKTEFDVNKLAGMFGGGGHPRASGCTIEEELENARIKLLEAMEFLP